MKMKLGEAMNNAAILSIIAQRKLPIKVGYAVSRNHDRLMTEQRDFEKKRLAMCMELAEKDADGNPVMEKSVVNGNPVENYKLSEDALKTLMGNLNELQDVEIDVDIMTIKFEQLEKIDGDPRYDALSPGELRALEFMIEE